MAQDLRADIAELKQLLDQATREKVKSVLSIELRRFETRLADFLEKEKEGSERSQQNSTAPASVTNGTSRAYDVNVKNYSWDQSDKFVKIYITGLSKGVNELAKDAFEFVVGESSLHFKISAFQGKNIIFNIKETPYKISAESSSFKAKSDMVAILLAKAEKGVKWSHLKKSDQIADNKPKFTPKADDSAAADPSANLMTMMKQMYEDGDDDMKRTIAKAWTESRDKQPGADEMGGQLGDL